jgi:hypothetical protein
MSVRLPHHKSEQPRQSLKFQRARSGVVYGLKTVGSFVPQLTRKAFEKYGFSAATLITDWAVIVGPEIAAYTAPERLKWPKRPEGSSEVDAGVRDKGRPGATLVLRVDGARALDVQYGSRQILERINAYFGYAAVAELRLLQAPVSASQPTPRRPLLQAAQPLSREVANIADPALRDALGRLGASVRLTVTPSVSLLQSPRTHER